MRVVVDTNVWVSGSILPDSVPGEAIEAARRQRVEAVVPWDLAQEILEVLLRPKIAHRIADPELITLVTASLRALTPDVEITVETRDPKDRPVITAALAANADAIVTGDKDLLDDAGLRAWLTTQSIEVITPAELLERIDRGRPDGMQA